MFYIFQGVHGASFVSLIDETKEKFDAELGRFAFGLTLDRRNAHPK